MTELIANLRAALRRADRSLDVDGRRRPGPQALAKLDAFDPRIGHPVSWIDYSTYRVDRGDLLGNMVRAARVRLEPAALAAAASRSTGALWDMTPQTDQRLLQPAA